MPEKIGLFAVEKNRILTVRACPLVGANQDKSVAKGITTASYYGIIKM